MKKSVLAIFLSTSLLFGGAFGYTDICPNENEVLSLKEFKIVNVGINNNNSLFVEKILSESRNSLYTLSLENKKLKNHLGKSKIEFDGLDEEKKNSQLGIDIQTKITNLQSLFETSEEDIKNFRKGYINLNYLKKIEDNEVVEGKIKTNKIFIQDKGGTHTEKLVSCINGGIIAEIESFFVIKNIEIISKNKLLGELDEMIGKLKAKDEDTSNSVDNYFEGIYNSGISLSGLGGSDTIDRSFLKTYKDKKEWIYGFISFTLENKNLGLTYLTQTVDTLDNKIIGGIPSLKDIKKETFNLIKNDNNEGYGFLKFSLNVFKDTKFDIGGEEFFLRNGKKTLIFSFSQLQKKWKISLFDDDGRIIKEKFVDDFIDIEFGEYVGIIKLTYKINKERIVSNVSFINNIKGYWGLLKDSGILDGMLGGKKILLPILSKEETKKTIIDAKGISTLSDKINNKILTNGKISKSLDSNNGKTHTINISHNLLKYFKDGAFESIEDLAKLVNVYGDLDKITESSNNDEFLKLLTKEFSGKTVLGGNDKLNVGSLYENSKDNIIVFERDINGGNIKFDGTLREYWIMDPTYKGDNNGKIYARGMFIVIGKLISVNKDKDGNITGSNIYLFPMIDQDWGSIINIGNMKNSFNTTEKIGQCGEEKYECGGLEIEKNQKYEESHIFKFLDNIKKKQCEIPKQTLTCLEKKINPPTTIIIGDNRKGLQDLILLKFTLDNTQKKIEDAIGYKFITSLPQYGSKILKVRRGDVNAEGKKNTFYIKSIQDEKEMKFVEEEYEGNHLLNLIITKSEDDFIKTKGTGKTNWLKQGANGLLTKEEIIQFFTRNVT